jgi:transcriptional regulator with PAS, ATPase and Fis domain
MKISNLATTVIPDASQSLEQQVEAAEHLRDMLFANNPAISKLARHSWLTTARERYITDDPATLDMLRTAAMLLKLPDPVLILGPSGTGKEIIARLLHEGRGSAGVQPPPMQALNAAGIPDQLLESLLFGYSKGAFTNASKDTPGLIESAGTGTFFLDEVGELSMFHQAKLLRVLQERTLRPVGSITELPVLCRFIFATRRDLNHMVKHGTFREDLFYRIAGATLRTTSLAERPLDAMLIAKEVCRRRGWSVPLEIPDALLKSPGNVRALEAYIFRTEQLGLDEEAALRDLL